MFPQSAVIIADHTEVEFDNWPWLGMFMSELVPASSDEGLCRTEVQLLVMKVSDRGQNVKSKEHFGCALLM